MTKRAQARHLNSQLDFLGDVVEVVVHPADAMTRYSGLPVSLHPATASTGWPTMRGRTGPRP